MTDLIALAIFIVTYAIIAIQKIPRVHISRAAGVLLGVLSPHEAYSAIDLDTIVFLLGDPVPYLLGLVLAANADSMATLIGNPQNMLIGLRSGLSFVEFFLALGPAALLSLIVICFGILVLFQRSLARGAAGDA